MPRLEEVFGISPHPVLSYVERPKVDGRFTTALRTENHIVIYGSSKQGKTALRQKHVSDDQCVIVRCGPKTTTETIYQSVLRDAGVRLEMSESQSDATKGSLKSTWSFKAVIPWIGGAQTDLEMGTEAARQKTLTTEFVGHDLAEAQSICELLQAVKFDKIIVLENFHYLPLETQKLVAFDLKAFHEVSLRFIILGIWQESDLLLVHNGDLQGRISEVPVEPWQEEDFLRVIEVGCRQLNCEIPSEIQLTFCTSAYGNVGMLQDFLKTYCALHDVVETLNNRKVLEDDGTVEKTFAMTVEGHKGRLVKVLDGIASRSRVDHDDSLTLPYYLAQVILTAPLEELRQGIRRDHLLTLIRGLHRRQDKETIRTGDITHLLTRLPSLQHDVNPPFLYYDTNQKRLKIVDATQLFVLTRVDRAELLEEIPDPMKKYDD